MLFDTHCHLNSEELYPRIKEVIADAKKANVQKFLVVGYNKETSLLAIKIAKKYDFCYAAIGFHPTEIVNLTDDDFKETLKLATKDNKVVAIGEIGLDYHWVSDSKEREIQKKYFIDQINFANNVGLPITIHCREANEDCFSIIKEHTPRHGLIMHCYSGSVEMMKEIVKIDNAFISLGGPVTFTNAKTPKEVAEEVPLDRLLLETDSPYLTPHPFRGMKNEPKYIALVSEEVANLRNMSRKTLEKATFDNACRVLNIKNEI